MISAAPPVKCVVWDLDETLWRGVLGEGDEVVVTTAVREVVIALDERGILQSVASRSDPAPALARLAALGLAEYFLAPKIGWGEKTASLAALARELDLPLGTFLFVDDDAFERDAVRFAHPEVRVVEASAIGTLLDHPDLKPLQVTEDGRARRAMYQRRALAQRDEEAFEGPRIDYLRTLGMVLTIAPATEADLDRAAELTVRTHQLNTTGRTCSAAELAVFARSPAHRLLICSLTDRHGDHGRIGLVLVEQTREAWTIKLLLMSCRVLSRSLGSTLIAYLLRGAVGAGVRLLAELVPTERNRRMMITYRFAGFRRVREEGGCVLLEHDLKVIPAYADHLTVRG
ncbi:MAG: HAD-IIIC family phosphatase [Byssovorax sp.]